MNNNKLFYYGILVGFIIFTIINSLPFSDASKYRQAIADCESNISISQHCKIIVIIDNTESQSYEQK